MTFSSTLQLRIFRDHSLDKKLASPPGLAARDGGNNSEQSLHCSISSDGKWPSLKREDDPNSASSGYSHPSAFSHQVTSTLPPHSTGISGPLTVPVSEEEGGPSAHSDWNVISSNSFDDTYLEGDYAGGAMSLGSSSSTSSLNHLSEPMNKLALENEDHDLPVISMPYPGTSWFFGGKAEPGSGSSFALPTLGGITPRAQTPCSAAPQSSPPFSTCTPIFHSSGADYSTASGKVLAETMPCPSDAPSPVQMESFASCLPHALEPSELLFEDLSSWAGAPAGVYDNQHYQQQQQQQQHVQTCYNVSSHMTAPNANLYFDGISTSTTTTLHDYGTPYQHNQHHSSIPAGPSIYRMMQNHDETISADTRWMTNQDHHRQSTPSTANTTPTDHGKNFDDHESRQPITPGSLHAADEGQSIKRILRSSTLTQRVSNCLHSVVPTSTASTMAGKALPIPATNVGIPGQSARIQLLTALNNCYWKNGRKNLQCFPSCPEHHDFYSMKMNNRKHSSVGVCRGPVYCHAFTNAAEFLPASSTQRMKHEYGTGLPSGGSSAREVFVLGRFERVPQQESTNLLEELNAPPSFPNAAVFEQFRFACFQAVEMEERRVLLPADPDSSGPKSESAEDHSKQRFIRSTWFFLPDVWKVQPMLKKKRKATRSAPAQTFPFCFRVFIYTRDVDGPGYSCVADAASSFFELYSTRTVDRVKRKFWNGESPSRDSATKQRGPKRL